ncbi:HD-GYP domain-containing protein [Paenibacillus xanthanilyticus]|uniref:HD-GYP domain-containing protein n=1 Tax=Paenibacillus xanthanilyticus TaxID=1783531 RepID=A0ABV8K3T7_9BACL
MLTKLLAEPPQRLILLLISILLSALVVFASLDAWLGGRYWSSDLITTLSTLTVISWGLFYADKRTDRLNNHRLKQFAIMLFFFIMMALTYFHPRVFDQAWTFMLFFPVLIGLFTSPREFRYYAALYLLLFVGLAAASMTGSGVRITSLMETGEFRILMAVGCVLVGAIAVIGRHQQAKRQVQQAFQQQKQLVIHLLQSFISVAERKTQTSRQEISEMSMLLKALWKEHQGNSSRDWEIDLLSLLHFVSRVKLPDYMFEKEGKLSPFELEVVQEHCFMARELCGDIPGFQEIQHIFLYHHERIDGSGYPYRLKENQIPLLSQMLGLVEVFLALTTSRSYREAMSRRDAYEEIRGLAGTAFRADIIDAFERVVK